MERLFTYFLHIRGSPGTLPGLLFPLLLLGGGAAEGGGGGGEAGEALIYTLGSHTHEMHKNSSV